MTVALVTGSAGLIGSEASRFFGGLGMDVVGVDNDMRKYFFGAEASTEWNRIRLEQDLAGRYTHNALDIRDTAAVTALVKRYGSDIGLVVHTAAQPSHDWAAREPLTDFGVNATGTLNFLEAVRRHAKDAVFIFTSTNKVYGDTPNFLPLVEQEKRWELDPGHEWARNGIPETMSIDHSTHSIFGASKVAADVLVQEYGRYFGIRTACFRGGCLTGPNHSGTQLHGFLAYLVKCAVTGTPYTVFGYKAKQVRDNIHSADLIAAFYEFYKAPRVAEVYNAGGGRFANVSMLEAIEKCEALTGRKMTWSYDDTNRVGDHMWYVSDLTRFQQHYPNWTLQYDIDRTIREIYEAMMERHAGASK